MGRHNNILAAVDIGTSKVVAVAAVVDEAGKVEILGVGKAPSAGVKRGVILNVRDTAEAISAAVRMAEKENDLKIGEVYVNIGGQHLKTATYNAQRDISAKRIVTANDVDVLYKEAANLQLPAEYKAYHIATQLFRIDKEGGIADPVGSLGDNLTVDYKLLVAKKDYEDSLKMCFDKAGIKICKVVVDAVATSEGLLSDEEKEAGVILLDMGAGTTKMAVYLDGVLCHVAVIPFGGNVITNDIREGCAILPKQAESLKVQYGQAMGEYAPDDKVVTIPGIAGWEPKEISFKNLAFIMQARLEEIIDAFAYQLDKSGCLERIGAGIVITGGGAMMPNINQLITFRTGLWVKKGIPFIKMVHDCDAVKDPRNATAIGLLAYALRESGKKYIKKKTQVVKTPIFQQSVRIKQWANQLTMFFEDKDTDMR